jgi:signal transduction histidine kinase/sugar phosphate isomerase/epimerase
MTDVAISTWLLHTYFLNPEITGLRLADFPRIARRYFGVGHIEIFEGDYAPDLSDPGFDHDRHAREVAAACRDAGVAVVCLAGINDLAQADEDRRRDDRRRVLRLADHCEALGCPVICVNTGRRRLDYDGAARLVGELRGLSDDLAGREVVLALENGPYMLDTEADVARYGAVVERVGRDNVRLCPDVGAIGPGLWRPALERLAPLTAHVHLRPFILDDSSQRVGLGDYAPAAREILDAHGYRGAVTLEYLPSLDLLSEDLGQDSRDTLLNVARAFGYPASPDPAWGERLLRPAGPTRQVNRDAALSLPPGVLALLAEGGSRRLGTQVLIHDLAARLQVVSGGVDDHAEVDWGATTTPHDEGRTRFCSLVALDPSANAECRKFHDRKAALISERLQARPCVFVCPMGLISVSVPIADEKTTYGLIDCGPQVENGTQGMLVERIRRLACPDLWRPLEEASHEVVAYSPFTLARSRDLLGELADDLGELYQEREQTHRYLVRGREIIQLLALLSEDGAIGVEGFIAQLAEPFRLFEEVVGFGRLALYLREPTGRGRERLRLRLPGPPLGRLPAVIELPPPKDAAAPEVSDYLRQTIEEATGEPCLVSARRASPQLVVFQHPYCVKDEGRLAAVFFDQFSMEINSKFTSIQNLTEAEARRHALDVFIDRFKHAISSPLQGLSDRVWQLRRGIEGQQALTFGRLRELVSDLRDFSTEAGMILERLTGRIRVNVIGSLRPQLTISRVAPITIIEESVRKLSGNAARRGVQIEHPLALGPPVVIEADPDALAEVFDNLLENAVKFAREGSRVSVLSCASSEATSPPWLLKVPGRRFVVRDTGLGIHPDDIELIFKPYVQGRAYLYNRVIRGTGLGLAICKQLVEAHGGAISASSQPLPGTERLPFPEDLHECVVEVTVDLPFQVPKAGATPEKGGP